MHILTIALFSYQSRSLNIYQDAIFDTMSVCAFSPKTAWFLGFLRFGTLQEVRLVGMKLYVVAAAVLKSDTPFCYR